MKKNERISTTPERMREAMADANMKQIELATATGLSHSSISRYLSGQMEPKQNAVALIAKALGVSEWWLWGYDVPRERTAEHKKNDQLVAVVKQFRADPEFSDIVSMLAELPAEQYGSIKSLILALRQK